MPCVVLGRELDRPTDAGALDNRVQVSNDPVSKFESDVRALIETEQVARLIAEAVLAEVFVEAVTQVKVPGARRKPQRCRKIHEDEVWFGRIEGRVVVRRLLCVSRRDSEQDSDE